MVTIPFTEYPAFSEEVDLDGTSYKLSFVWNSRGEFWTLTFADIDGDEILSGIKLVLNYELLQEFHYLPIPPGFLFVLETTNNQTNARVEYDDFTGERALQLVYVTEAEVAAIP